MEQAKTHESSSLYDVLIVGAGPAGSSAAFHFCQAGFSVLLVDRKHFPRDKACGDAIMPAALAEVAHLGLLETVQQQFYPVTRVATTMRGQRSVQSLQSSGLLAPRKEFDLLLWQHAQQQGCSWQGQVTIRRIDYSHSPDYVVAHGVHSSYQHPLHLRARLIIVADGSASLLAQQVRHMVLDEPAAYPGALVFPEQNRALDEKARQTALRCYWRDLALEEDVLEFFFPLAGPVHYFWAFPIGSQLTNVGVIATLAQSHSHKLAFPKALHDFLHNDLSHERTAEAIQEGSWSAAPLATGLRKTALYGSRVICIGDAAALIDPLSGEGISAALWSGRMAALIATEALRQDTIASHQALSPYAEMVKVRYAEAFAQRLSQL